MFIQKLIIFVFVGIFVPKSTTAASNVIPKTIQKLPYTFYATDSHDSTMDKYSIEIINGSNIEESMTFLAKYFNKEEPTFVALGTFH